MSENISAYMERLVQRLMTGTESGKIKWADTDSNGTFVFTVGNSSVVLDENRLSDGRQRITLRLLNSDGIAVEEVRSTWASSALTGGRPTASEWNVLLLELHTAARRSAYNVKGVIDELMQSLDEVEKG